MTAGLPRRPLTLGIYPTSRGFGWVAMESPLAPFDWGLVEVRRDKNQTCMLRIEELLNRLMPETIVLETFEKRNSRRTDRIAKLCRGIAALGADRGIDVLAYSCCDIETCFATLGARTRHEIAEAVARHLPALADRLPAKRPVWKSEDRRMALFNAAALVLARFRYGAQNLFVELEEAVSLDNQFDHRSSDGPHRCQRQSS